MKDEFIRKKIEDLYYTEKITKKSKGILMRNIECINSRLRDKKITCTSDDFDSQFESVCKFVVETSSYSFKTAFADSDCESVDEFLNEYWLHNTMVLHGANAKITVRYADVYNACATTEYLDANTGVSPKQFCDGDFNDEAFDALFDALVTNNISFECERKEAGVLNVGEESEISNESNQIADLFTTIISADELRKNDLKVNAVKNEAYRILTEFYKKMYKSVFRGEKVCTVETAILDDYELKLLCNELEDHQFRVSILEKGEVCKLRVECIAYDGDFTSYYNETDLGNMLLSKDGSVFSFVADYCEKVVVPRIVAKSVKEIAERLANVKISDDSLHFNKIKTKTNAYAVLFAGLRAKGFEVVDKGNEFVMRW